MASLLAIDGRRQDHRDNDLRALGEAIVSAQPPHAVSRPVRLDNAIERRAAFCIVGVYCYVRDAAIAVALRAPKSVSPA
jgi:hypothetical protein